MLQFQNPTNANYVLGALGFFLEEPRARQTFLREGGMDQLMADVEDDLRHLQLAAEGEVLSPHANILLSRVAILECLFRERSGLPADCQVHLQNDR